MTLPACAHTRDEMPGAESKAESKQARRTGRNLDSYRKIPGTHAGGQQLRRTTSLITRALRLSETLTQRERRIKEFSSDATSLLAWQSNAAGLKQ